MLTACPLLVDGTRAFLTSFDHICTLMAVEGQPVPGVDARGQQSSMCDAVRLLDNLVIFQHNLHVCCLLCLSLTLPLLLGGGEGGSDPTSVCAAVSRGRCLAGPLIDPEISGLSASNC